MPLMEWSQQLELEVDSMNNQHQQLLDLMNKLFDENQNNVGKDQLLSTLNDLANFTIKHFEDEEAYMESIDFPKLSVHKQIHKDLIEKFVGHKQGFESGSEQQLPGDFFQFLQLWLKAHIMGIDKQYSDHAHQKAA